MSHRHGFTILAATGLLLFAGPARPVDAQTAAADRMEAAVRKAEAAANKAEAAATQAETSAKGASAAAQKAEELSQKAEELSHRRVHRARRAARVRAAKEPAVRPAAAPPATPPLAAARPAVSTEAIGKELIDYYRRKANVSPAINIQIVDTKPSPIAGAQTGELEVGGRKVSFTISDDGRYAFFGELEDLTVDPFASVMKKISLKDVPSRGPANAKVTIVEYSDFQCPFCARGYQTLENQVLKDYGDRVRFVFKNFPLPMHPWATAAAVASECAREQKPDAFWKLYNFYFQNQRDITPQNLKDKSLEVLKDDGVDPAKFSDCFDNKKTLDLVKAEQAEGGSVGVNGTPAFIINGRLISGAQPYDNFKAVIDDELARAEKK